MADPHNRRLKVYGLIDKDAQGLKPKSLLEAASEGDALTKLTLYARPGEPVVWSDHGFREEARIRGFFGDDADAVLWAAYTDSARARAGDAGELDRVVETARGKGPARPALPEGWRSEPASENDAGELSDLLAFVFPDYPSSIDPGHLARQIRMRANLFRWVRDGDGEMVAAASAEIDHRRRSAEMTDCATRPEARGRGLMVYLLRALEDDLAAGPGITGLYTLARAGEVGMNCAFAKLGYDYTGRLVNNCRMPGGWESMNVWCRSGVAWERN